MKLTVAVLHCIRLLFYTKTALDIKFLFYLSDAATHRANRHPQKCIQHGTLRPKLPPLLTGFPFMATFSQFKGNLCTAVTLYITVTWLFPKGDVICRFDCIQWTPLILFPTRAVFPYKQESSFTENWRATSHIPVM